MNFDESLSNRQEIAPPPRNSGGGWRAVLFVAALAIAFAAGSWLTRGTNMPNAPTLITPTSSLETPVIIQISGQVKKPGVYQLPFNSRVYQAIEKAGGLLPDAETADINLADWVKDGSQIVVPAKNTSAAPSPEATKTDSAIDSVPLALDSQPAEIAAPTSTFPKEPKATPPKPATPKPHKSTSKEPPKTSIDLNRATSEELQQLPGVGPAMAERILQYRKENRGFASVDDLDNVRGIGVKTLEKLRPFVIVKSLPFQKSVN